MSNLGESPAFPTPDCSEWDGDLRTPGMSTRTWLAGKAMGSLLSNQVAFEQSITKAKQEDVLPGEIIAKVAVLSADQLIAELEKPRE